MTQGVDPALAPLVVMFVRHGEKPGKQGPPHGINHYGEHDAHSLSVRGWTRAGALAVLIANAPLDAYPHMVVPDRIIATKPSHEAKSRREVDTAVPLARRLDVEIDEGHGHGHEEALRESILTDPRNTLVVWHHGTMAHLVRGFPISNPDDVPKHWPDERFDLIWILTREPDERAYRFIGIAQRLLDGDEGIAGSS